MHAVSSYGSNRPYTQTHRQDRLQYTAPLSLARSVIIKVHVCHNQCISFFIARQHTMTFDLSTSKCGRGSPVSCASFLPIFSPSVLHLGSGTGQTDRQTTAISALCPTLWGRGHNNGTCLNSFWVYVIALHCDEMSSVESTEMTPAGLVKKLICHESSPVYQLTQFQLCSVLYVCRPIETHMLCGGYNCVSISIRRPFDGRSAKVIKSQ